MIRNVCAFFVVVTTLTLVVFAGEPLRITSFTIDGGGVMRSTSDDGGLVLSGTIGQPDAGPAESGLSGGDFRLTGGFWFETQRGDCNGNGARDLGDHKEFVDCMGGPNPDEEALGACRCFDTSGDQLVDLLDFAETQNVFGSQ